MPYYPLSQIQTDLFTNGNEYVIKSNLSPYKGSYYKISTGKSFTGNVPSNQSKEIILIDLATNQPISDNKISIEVPSSKIVNIVSLSSTDDAGVYDNKGNIIYKANTSNYTSDSQPRTLPSSYYPVLTQEQKNKGQLTRYFAKKSNELRYIEVDKKTYDALESKSSDIAFDLYVPASLIWKIKGDKQEIYTSNKAATTSVEQQFRWPGFSQYFKDKFTQFYLED